MRFISTTIIVVAALAVIGIAYNAFGKRGIPDLLLPGNINNNVGSREPLEPLEGTPVLGRSSTYTNRKYVYELKYPLGFAARENTSQYVSIGIPTGGTSDTFVAGTVVESGEAGYRNFNDFIFDYAQLLCTSDGPTETIGCPRVERQRMYMTSTGFEVTELYYRLVTENLQTGQRISSLFGPIYAFDLASTTPQSDFAALFIYRPYGATSTQATPEFVRGIANTVTIGSIENR
ncbi:MAG: hypothetical protein V4526_01060 [Patescibacteria group bacterium]